MQSSSIGSIPSFFFNPIYMEDSQPTAPQTLLCNWKGSDRVDDLIAYINVAVGTHQLIQPLQELDEAIKKHPTDSRLPILKVRLLHLLKKITEAISLAESIMAKCPKPEDQNLDLWLIWITAHSNRSVKDIAQADLLEAYQRSMITSTFKNSHFVKTALLAMVRSHLKPISSASQKVLHEGVKKSPHHPLILFAYVSTIGAEGDWVSHFRTFCEQPFNYPIELALDALVNGIKYKQYDLVERWLEVNRDKTTGNVDIAFIKATLAFLKGNAKELDTQSTKLISYLERKPFDQFAHIPFVRLFGHSRCTLRDFLNTYNRHVDKNLLLVYSNLCYELQEYTLAYNALNTCTLYFPDDASCWSKKSACYALSNPLDASSIDELKLSTFKTLAIKSLALLSNQRKDVLESKSPSVHLDLARGYIAFGLLNNALSCLEKSSETARKHLLLVAVHVGMDNLSEALDSTDNALTLNPHNIEALNEKCKLYQKLGQFEKSLIAIDQKLKIDPSCPSTTFQKSLILFSLNRNQEAWTAWNKAKSLYMNLPMFWEFGFTLALNCLKDLHGDEPQTLARSVTPQESPYYELIVEAYGNLNGCSKFENEPKNTFITGQSAFLLGKKELAKDLLLPLQGLEEADANERLVILYNLYKDSNPQLAESFIEELYLKNPTNPIYLKSYLDVLVDLQKFKLARSLLSKHAEVPKLNDFILGSLFTHYRYYKNCNLQKALAYLDELIALDPFNIKNILERIDVLITLEEFDLLKNLLGKYSESRYEKFGLEEHAKSCLLAKFKECKDANPEHALKVMRGLVNLFPDSETFAKERIKLLVQQGDYTSIPMILKKSSHEVALRAFAVQMLTDQMSQFIDVDTARTLQCLKALTLIQPQRVDFLKSRIELLVRTKDYDQAKVLLTKNPEFPARDLLLGWIEGFMKRTQKPLEQYKALFKTLDVADSDHRLKLKMMKRNLMWEARSRNFSSALSEKIDKKPSKVTLKELYDSVKPEAKPRLTVRLNPTPVVSAAFMGDNLEEVLRQKVEALTPLEQASILKTLLLGEDLPKNVKAILDHLTAEEFLSSLPVDTTVLKKNIIQILLDNNVEESLVKSLHLLKIPGVVSWDKEMEASIWEKSTKKFCSKAKIKDITLHWLLNDIPVETATKPKKTLGQHFLKELKIYQHLLSKNEVKGALMSLFILIKINKTLNLPYPPLQFLSQSINTPGELTVMNLEAMLHFVPEDFFPNLGHHVDHVG